MTYGVVVNLTKRNGYSFAALLGAIQLDHRLKDLQIVVTEESKFLRCMSSVSKRFDQMIVCDSIMSGELSRCTVRLNRLRSLLNKKKIVYIAGGPHPTGEPVGTLKMGIDIAVLGEGEKVFPELIYRIVNGKCYDDLDGIAFAQNETNFKINTQKERVDINAYPPFAVAYGLFAPIEISRGCPWVCKFCQTPRIFGFEMRHRTCDNIVKYVKVAAAHGYSNMWFISPNAFAYGSPNGKAVQVDQIKRLLSSIRDVPGIEKIFFGTFPSEVRPESVTRDALTAVTEYTSNRTLTIGAQSGSERILMTTGRGHTVEDVRNAVDLVLDFGITPHLDFLFGLPEETRADLEKTKGIVMEFIKKGAKIHAHAFMPLPGTPYQDEEPRPLDKETRRWLSTLAKSGKVDGYWSQHERIASDIRKARCSLNS